VGRVHRHGADSVVSKVLLHLGDQRAAVGPLDAKRGVDLRELVREDGVDHDALDLDQAADVLAAAVALGHGSPGKGKLFWKLLLDGGGAKRERPPAGDPVYRSARAANDGGDDVSATTKRVGSLWAWSRANACCCWVPEKPMELCGALSECGRTATANAPAI